MHKIERTLIVVNFYFIQTVQNFTNKDIKKVQ